MTSQTFNVGIVGYGMSAKIFHIPLITTVPKLKLYAIVQRSPKLNDDAEKDWPGIHSYRNSEGMIRDEAVHLVIITTPPETHFAISKLALESGKHGILLTMIHCLRFCSKLHSSRGETIHPNARGSR